MQNGPHAAPRRLLSHAPVVLGMLAATALILAGATPAPAQRSPAEGNFQDASGKAHPWTIQPNHTLTWDGKPYLPAGVVFRPKALRQPTEEQQAADRRTLDSLKAGGVQDLWIDGGSALLSVPIERIQALLNEVEARGFRYGLRIGDRSAEPLIGFTPGLRPIAVPAEMIRPGAQPQWNVDAEGRRVIFTLAALGVDEKTHLYPLAVGEATVLGSKAQIQIPINPASKLAGRSRALLISVPEVQVEPEQLGSFGDLWEGLESYSDRVKALLKSLKFGPGFRFLLDPIDAGDGTTGREDGVVPSSRVFQTAFRDWLQRKGGVTSLNVRWRSTDRQIPSLEEACRLVPTWPPNDAPEGDAWLIDPLDRVAYRCIPRQCRFWTDLEDFRAEWLRRWMNLIASTLKQEVMDAPVIYSWGSFHPLFTNSPSPAGYDGLGARMIGDPARLRDESAAYALAQIEESDRSEWLIAARLGAPAGAAGAYPLDSVWTGLREAGFRGAFLDPDAVPDAPGLARRLAQKLAEDPTLATERTRVCYFPLALASTGTITRFPNGVWWLPSTQPALLLRYGDSLVGYQMPRPFGQDHPVQDATVLWSTSGKQKTTFYHDGLTPVEFFDTTGKPQKFRVKKGEIQLNLGDEPVIATGLKAETIFPLELALTTLREFESLLVAAEAQRLDTTAMRYLHKQARENLVPNSAGAVYNSLLPHLMTLREALSPFIWMEGERPTSHNFSGQAFQAGCSAGNYLRLDRADPAKGGYEVRYAFDVKRDATYDLWVAGRLPGVGGSSPVAWSVDGESGQIVAKPVAAGKEYSHGMSWFTLGRATLKVGRHEIRLTFPEPGAAGRFVAGIDVVLLSRGPFTPSGTEKPYLTAVRPGKG